MHLREAPEAELTAWGLPGAKALRPGQDWSRVKPEQNFLESPCLSFCTSQYLRGLRRVPPIARGTSIQKPGFSFPATVLKPCLSSLSSPFCVQLIFFTSWLFYNFLLAAIHPDMPCPKAEPWGKQGWERSGMWGGN